MIGLATYVLFSFGWLVVGVVVGWSARDSCQDGPALHRNLDTDIGEPVPGCPALRIVRGGKDAAEGAPIKAIEGIKA